MIWQKCCRRMQRLGATSWKPLELKDLQTEYAVLFQQSYNQFPSILRSAAVTRPACEWNPLQAQQVGVLTVFSCWLWNVLNFVGCGLVTGHISSLRCCRVLVLQCVRGISSSISDSKYSESVRPTGMNPPIIRAIHAAQCYRRRFTAFSPWCDNTIWLLNVFVTLRQKKSPLPGPVMEPSKVSLE